MTHFPWDIIFLAVVALLLAAGIYFVLGRRVGAQGVRQNHTRLASKMGTSKKVTSTTGLKPPPLPGSVQPVEKPTEYIVPDNASELGQKLQTLSDFQGKTFLQTAQNIFTDVVTGFAKGDHSIFVKYLAPHVGHSFQEVLKKRDEDTLKAHCDLKRIEKLEILSVKGEDESAPSLDVCITSWQVSYVKDVQGSVKEGTEALTEFKDVWRFVKNEEGRWIVTATAAAE